MAVNKTSGTTRVESTAVLVLAANANRRFCAFAIEGGPVRYGPTNAVTGVAGMQHREEWGPLSDSIPTTDDWYFICTQGKTATVSWIEITDV